MHTICADLGSTTTKIIEVDENFEIITGYSKEDIKKNSIYQGDLIPEEDREEYFKNVYIPVKICHINKAYYYYFGFDDFGEDNPYIKRNKDNKSITFNLFEPKLKKES